MKASNACALTHTHTHTHTHTTHTHNTHTHHTQPHAQHTHAHTHTHTQPTHTHTHTHSLTKFGNLTLQPRVRIFFSVFWSTQNIFEKLKICYRIQTAIFQDSGETFW